MQEKNDQVRQGTFIKKKSPKKTIELEDIQALKEKTLELLSDDDKKPKPNTFTSERMINSTLEVYRSLLEQS